MGRYLTPGHTYVNGDVATGPSITEHVSEAILKPTAISEQALKDPAALSDELLINDGGALKKVTLHIVQTLVRTGFAAIPIGTIVDFAGTVEPENWIFCYGQEVSRETYADLFAVIGTTYGDGNGSTSFLLPDLRGRVAAGKDDMGGASAARLANSGLVGHGVASTELGGAGGAQQHTLTVAELASHNHSASTAAPMNTSSVEAGGYGLLGGTPPFNNRVYIQRGFETACSTSIGSSGSNNSHNNVQPTFILNKIIRYI